MKIESLYKKLVLEKLVKFVTTIYNAKPFSACCILRVVYVINYNAKHSKLDILVHKTTTDLQEAGFCNIIHVLYWI